MGRRGHVGRVQRRRTPSAPTTASPRALDGGVAAPVVAALVVRVMAEGKPLAGAAVKLFAFAGIDANRHTLPFSEPAAIEDALKGAGFKPE